MGARMLRYLQYAKEKGGDFALTRFMLKTGVSEKTAEGKPDTPEELEKLHSTLSELLKDPSVPRF